MVTELRCEIFPADMDRTVEFYSRALAFELVRDERDKLPPCTYLRRGQVRVAATGWPLVEDLTERPWELRDFRLLDPDGYYWRITTH